MTLVLLFTLTWGGLIFLAAAAVVRGPSTINHQPSTRR